MPKSLHGLLYIIIHNATKKISGVGASVTSGRIQTATSLPRRWAPLNDRTVEQHIYRHLLPIRAWLSTEVQLPLSFPFIIFMNLPPLADNNKKLEIVYFHETGSHISHRVAQMPEY